ncbi:MAG: histone deacetylase [Bradymonadales bacterium]|jgi:acetoin utilization deacetylase AcuC-like enzyme
MNLEQAMAMVKEGTEELSRLKRRLFSQVGKIPYLPQTTFIFRKEYVGSTGAIADFERGQKILNYLLYEGCISEGQVISPKTATITQLNLVHDFSYLSRLHERDVAERIFGQNLESKALRAHIAQQRIMTGGTIRAARIATAPIYPRRIINLGGGFHHAYPEAGYAFCVFNDVAIAIAHLRKHGFDKPILIIDLDLHQGDGNKSIFANDPMVTTYSVHAEDWEKSHYPNNHDIALGPGIGDEAYLHAIKLTLPNIIQKVKPYLVFYLAGVDVAEDDELGDWRISHDAIFERDVFVHQAVGKRRMVILTAGGYGRNAWRHSARFFAYLSAGLNKPIASDNQRLFESIRNLSRGMQVLDLTSEDEGDDDFNFFAQTHRKTILFDYYSQYGIECALERFGVYPHLRNLGFLHNFLHMDLEHPNGQCLRLYGDEEKKMLLIEVVLDEKKDDDGHKLLWIEWLLLQNPSIASTSDRLLLPGQTHPGLGCLHKIMGMIFMICERLHFDGVGFNPAHYHICFLAKGEGCFENPEAEAQFRVAQRLVAGMDIAQASHALSQGIELNDKGQIYKWVPSRMIIPRSQAMRSHFQSPKYQREVERLAAIALKQIDKRRTNNFRRKR